MTARRTRTLSLLLVFAAGLAALFGSPPGATARPRTAVQPRSKWISVELPKRGGWQVNVEVATHGKLHTPVSIDATGPRGQNLTYGAEGKLTKEDAIIARFPGIGRIDVSFDQTETKESADSVEPGCTSPRGTLNSEGTFRGRIAIHDRKSFGSFDLRAAPGSITDFPAETCPASRRRRETEPTSSEPEATSIHASRKLSGGILFLDVESVEAGGGLGTAGHPVFAFSAQFFKHHDGLSMSAQASAPIVPKGFNFVAVGGSLTEATVEPPAPFHGSATFKVESPTTGSWSGDLSVELATLGPVRLTGPPFEAGLCVETTCLSTSAAR
jgi:hypothetical protein